jgi:GNAT superfamily N-acetyltransferase
VKGVRAASEADLQDLVRLWRGLEEVQGSLRFYPPSPNAEERIEASFRDAIGSADADVLVVVDGEETVGMALVRAERPSRTSDELAAELSRVVVRDDRRGGGFGALLVDAARDWARARGIRSLSATIFVSNEAGRGFWLGRGFVPWAERIVREVDP